MSRKSSWKDPYKQQRKQDTASYEFSEGWHDGSYCKVWAGNSYRYPNKWTKAYKEGFKSAAGFSVDDYHYGRV